MPALVAVICVSCGATLQRHPAMRLRRAVCFECQRLRKKEQRERTRQRERIKRAVALVTGTPE